MLAKLFTSPALGHALKNAATTHHLHGKARISLAWIDKRPVAAATGVRRTEYGDMALFRIHGYSMSNGDTGFNSRCLLLQAKVAKEQNQMASPSVPVNPSKPRPGTSTAREYDLLVNWPTHDMYEYGSSGTPLAKNLNVSNARAWYMATPKSAPTTQGTAWRSPWMCGPADTAAQCDVTLGEVMMAFIESTRVHRASVNSNELVGASFTLDVRELHKSAAPASSGWDRVCVEILRGMREFNLPSFLTGGVAQPGAKTIKLFANPIEPMWAWLIRGWEFMLRRFGRSKMLVVIVSTYSDG